ncbi:MAG: NAD(P)H-hydrate epimerase, partial [Acidimicrobiia bacterium]
MRAVVTPADMAEADRNAIARGTPEDVLVARAASGVARVARRMLGGTYGRRVVVVAGKGNNGADGRVAADLLRARGVGVDVFALTDDLDEAGLGRALARADLFVDAMFGTGFRGALTGAAAQVVEAAARAGVATLSVDIPSGVDGATGAVTGAAVHATETVTFAALKLGLLFEPGRGRAGRVTVEDIGIDVRTERCVVPEVGDLRLPRREPTAHKWSYGCMVFGGSNGMTGAPMLAARAAARAGAAMVVCALP